MGRVLTFVNVFLVAGTLKGGFPDGLVDTLLASVVGVLAENDVGFHQRSVSVLSRDRQGTVAEMQAGHAALHNTVQSLVLLPEVFSARLRVLQGYVSEQPLRGLEENVDAGCVDLWRLLSEHFTTVRHIHFSDGRVANHCSFLEDSGDVLVIGRVSVLTTIEGRGGQTLQRRGLLPMTKVLYDLELDVSAFQPPAVSSAGSSGGGGGEDEDVYMLRAVLIGESGHAYTLVRDVVKVLGEQTEGVYDERMGVDSETRAPVPLSKQYWHMMNNPDSTRVVGHLGHDVLRTEKHMATTTGTLARTVDHFCPCTLTRDVWRHGVTGEYRVVPPGERVQEGDSAWRYSHFVRSSEVLRALYVRRSAVRAVVMGALMHSSRE